MSFPLVRRIICRKKRKAPFDFPSFTKRGLGEIFAQDTDLIVALQVHPGIEAADFLLIAVEDDGFALALFADPALGRLAPAGMGDKGVDVGVKAATPRDWPSSRRSWASCPRTGSGQWT